jgi:dethiobiotin synthetase
MRGCFITGTDTGVGKSVLTAAIVAALNARGIPLRALKPIITGLDEAADAVWLRDHELLARAAGVSPETTLLAGYGPPVSPHLAAALAGRPLELDSLVAGIRAAAAPGAALIVEGVGGLLVPLSEAADVRDLALALGLPLVIAARPGLGTINHTLLTLEAARAAGLEPVAVVLTPWPSRPSEMELSNRETIARRGRIEVATLHVIADAQPEVLAAAAAELPLERWLR